MKYPVTDLHVSEILKAASTCIPTSSPLREDALELARFFEFRHWLARLTTEDMERVAVYAKECARRTKKNELVIRQPTPWEVS